MKYFAYKYSLNFFRKENFTFDELLDALLENKNKEKAECSKMETNQEEMKETENEKPGQLITIV